MSDPANPPRQAVKPNPTVPARRRVIDRNYQQGPTAKLGLQPVEEPEVKDKQED